jgi:hypothetical protein
MRVLSLRLFIHNKMENTKKTTSVPIILQSNKLETGHDAGMTLKRPFAGFEMQGHLASYYGAGVHCDQENMGYLAKSFMIWLMKCLNVRCKRSNQAK